MDSDPPPPNSSLSNIDLQTLANLITQLNAIQDVSSKHPVHPIMDPSTPFFIHPGEQPGKSLIPIVLDNKNYGSWSRSMRMVLKSKNKLAFVDGFLPPPSKDDATFEAWDRCNTLVASWITHSLSPDIASSVIWNSNAHDI
ncbi:uncharacterized protein [Arachis hypogaea]|uniref:uncharacterized protein n=1 Tax=Arachis hypogaea TaxID=3818 RepID=UPI003B2200A2